MGAVIDGSDAQAHADKNIVGMLEESGDDIAYENQKECENLDIYEDFKSVINEMGRTLSSGVSKLKKGYFSEYL